MMSGPLDVAKARRDTPACERLAHLNNAGAGLMPQPVLNAYMKHLQMEADIGSYEAGEKMAAQDQALGQGFYASAAQLLNCRASDIAFFDSATQGWNTLFHSAVLGLNIGPGDRVLVSASEYVNNYMAMVQLSDRHGFGIEPVDCDTTGAISVEALEQMMNDRVKMITLTHVPANSGLINPAAGVGKIARHHGVPFMLDAAQSVGQMPLDVKALGCDMLVATGRKFLRGPRGTGFAYVNPDFIDQLEVPTITNQTAMLNDRSEIVIQGGAARFENWETNIAGRQALGVAIDYALGWGMEEIRAQINDLAMGLRDRLATIGSVSVVDQGIKRGGIVCIDTGQRAAGDLVHALRRENINTAVIQPVQTFLDSQKRSLPPLLRASVHYYNTESELDQFTKALERLIR